MKLLFILGIFAFWPSLGLKAETLTDPLDYRYQYFKLIPTHNYPGKFEFELFKCGPRFDGVESCQPLKGDVANSCLQLNRETELYQTYSMAYYDSFKIINASFRSFTVAFLEALGVKDPYRDWETVEFASGQGYRKKFRILSQLSSRFVMTASEKKSINIATYLTEKQLKRYKKKGKLPKGKEELPQELAQKKKDILSKYQNLYNDLSAIRVGIYLNLVDGRPTQEKPGHNVIVEYQQDGSVERVSRQARATSFGWVYPAGWAKPRAKKSDVSRWNARYFDKFLEVFKTINFTVKSKSKGSETVSYTPRTLCSSKQ